MSTYGVGLYEIIDGVVRWKSNGRVPFPDKLAEFLALGLITSDHVNASTAARTREDAKFVKEYRAKASRPSSEELSEMRAAFGPGVEVVNVLSGRRTKL